MATENASPPGPALPEWFVPGFAWKGQFIIPSPGKEIRRGGCATSWEIHPSRFRAARDRGEFPRKQLRFEWKHRACPKSKLRGISRCGPRLPDARQFPYWQVPRRAFEALRVRAAVGV